MKKVSLLLLVALALTVEVVFADTDSIGLLILNSVRSQLIIPSVVQIIWKMFYGGRCVNDEECLEPLSYCSILIDDFSGILDGNVTILGECHPKTSTIIIGAVVGLLLTLLCCACYSCCCCPSRPQPRYVNI